MSSGVLPFGPVVLPARSGVNADVDRKNPDLQIRSTTSPPASNKWWAPLFGFPPEPDYINPVDEKSTKPVADGGDSKPGKKTRFAPGSFTEEKARQLRRLTYDASSFHESMYHSAIASRLASDFSDRTSA